MHKWKIACLLAAAAAAAKLRNRKAKCSSSACCEIHSVNQTLLHPLFFWCTILETHLTRRYKLCDRRSSQAGKGPLGGTCLTLFGTPFWDNFWYTFFCDTLFGNTCWDFLSTMGRNPSWSLPSTRLPKSPLQWWSLTTWSSPSTPPSSTPSVPSWSTTRPSMTSAAGTLTLRGLATPTSTGLTIVIFEEKNCSMFGQVD